MHTVPTCIQYTTLHDMHTYIRTHAYKHACIHIYIHSYMHYMALRTYIDAAQLPRMILEYLQYPNPNHDVRCCFHVWSNSAAAAGGLRRALRAASAGEALSNSRRATQVILFQPLPTPFAVSFRLSRGYVLNSCSANFSVCLASTTTGGPSAEALTTIGGPAAEPAQAAV